MDVVPVLTEVRQLSPEDALGEERPSEDVEESRPSWALSALCPVWNR